MNDAHYEMILAENRKQTEYLRQTRNWIRALGVFFVLIPIIGGLLSILGVLTLGFLS